MPEITVLRSVVQGLADCLVPKLEEALNDGSQVSHNMLISMLVKHMSMASSKVCVNPPLYRCDVVWIEISSIELAVYQTIAHILT